MPVAADLLRLEVRDGLAVLTLDDPDRRNAMSEPMTAAWSAALAEVRGRAGRGEVRAVVVTGAGATFSSGGDTGWIVGPPEETEAAARDRLLAFYRAWLGVRRLPVPVVAAVDGPAVGAGLCLALACDVRMSSARATFAAPFTRIGIAPGMGATALLPAVVGRGLADDLLLTGRRLDAGEAQRAGLVTRVLPSEGFAGAVDVAVGPLLAAAPLATAATLAALRGDSADLDAVLVREAAAQAATVVTADAQEGLSAVGERRAPLFRGR